VYNLLISDSWSSPSAITLFRRRPVGLWAYSTIHGLGRLFVKARPGPGPSTTEGKASRNLQRPRASHTSTVVSHLSSSDLLASGADTPGLVCASDRRWPCTSHGFFLSEGVDLRAPWAHGGCQCRTIGTQALFDTISRRHEPAMCFLLDLKVWTEEACQLFRPCSSPNHHWVADQRAERKLMDLGYPVVFYHLL
jgi:hypothetical protein